MSWRSLRSSYSIMINGRSLKPVGTTFTVRYSYSFPNLSNGWRPPNHTPTHRGATQQSVKETCECITQRNGNKLTCTPRWPDPYRTRYMPIHNSILYKFKASTDHYWIHILLLLEQFTSRPNYSCNRTYKHTTLDDQTRIKQVIS